MLAVLLAAVGISSVPVMLLFRRASRSRAERESRRRAEMIRQRLEETPRVEYRELEIRLGNH
jgi:hypothetical protein